MRKILITLFIAMLIAAVPTLAQNQDDEDLSTDDGVTTIEGDRVDLRLYFDNIAQGRVGLVSLHGENIESASAEIFMRRVEFFSISGADNSLYGLIVVDSSQSMRTYEMVVTVRFEDSDEPETLRTRVTVTDGGFIQQSVTLPPDDELLQLLDREVEESELTRIFEVASVVTDNALWDQSGFTPPLNTELTSPFGAVRKFNDNYDSTHTGWDFQAVIGMPIFATASGRVALAEHLPLRGNHVMVDHGRGVYSGYSHLSVVYVTEGQEISAGQVIGLVGSTGRSTSAHAHFEMIVDQRWVDAAQFLRVPLP